jgi:hypothetical protein
MLERAPICLTPPSMSRRTVTMLTAVLAVALAIAVAGPPPAFADSTVSGTVPGGGSLRSSTDAAPSAANPVIVTVTTAEDFKQDGSGCRTNCSDGPSMITIAMKDQHDRTLGAGLEGPNGNDLLGPQIDISSSEEPDGINIAKVVFDIDASLVRPGHVTGYPFGYQAVRPGQPSAPSPLSFAAPNDPTGEYAFAEKLPDGDYRLTTLSISNSSIDLLQQSWFVFGYGLDGNLTEARTKGMSVWMKTNYKSSESWKVTVSSAVARTLKLKSTTIGQKSFPKPGGKNRRIPLVPAARKALRKYNRVVVKLHLTAKGPDGNVQRDVRSVTLKKPESELR